MNKEFSSEIIKKLCVDCGLLDVTTNTCPDLFAIINPFSINWSKIQGGKQRFVSTIPSAFTEMFKYCVIHEFYDDEHDFTVDRDANGIVYILHRVIDHLYRSNVKYYAAVLKKKREEINAVYERLQLAQVKSQEKGKAIITYNRKYEKKLLAKLNLPINTTIDAKTFEPITMEFLQSINANFLSEFWIMCTENDVMPKVITPNKGTTLDILNAKKCKKINGPLLLALVYACRFKTIIGTLPELEPIT